MASDFTGRVAVVTGGSNGIGRAVRDALAAAGAEVLTLDVEPGPEDTLLVDLAEEEAVPAAARAALAWRGRVDVLVNCAGISVVSSLPQLDLASYRRLLAIDLHAAVMLMNELGGAMARAGYGRIVNVTSVHARVGEPGALAYDVSKAGLEAATRVAALDLAGSGVLVNAVAPGFVATRMSLVDGVDELSTDWFRQVYLDGGRLPLGRAAAPAEIAAPVLWLASEENSYITGQVLVVDGGLTVRF